MTETPDAEAVQLHKLVSTYLAIRTAMDEQEQLYEAVIKPMKEQYEVLSAAILDICNKHDADTIRTAVGTISRRITSRYWTSDWEALYKVVLDNEAPFLFEQRIHNSNMKQFLEEHPDAFPAGLQADRKYTISVRKPNAK